MRAVQAHTLLKEGDLEPSPIEGHAVAAVRDACVLEGWQSVSADSPTTAQVVIGQGGSTYWTLSKPPPMLNRTTRTSSTPSLIPQWGTPTTLEESEQTRDLPEFESGSRQSATKVHSRPKHQVKDRPAVHNASGRSKVLDQATNSRKRSRDFFDPETPEDEAPRKIMCARKSSTPPVVLVASTPMASKPPNTPAITKRKCVSVLSFIQYPHCKPVPSPDSPRPPVSPEALKQIPERSVHTRIEARYPPLSSTLPNLDWDDPHRLGNWHIPLNGAALLPAASSARVTNVSDYVHSASASTNLAPAPQTSTPPPEIIWTPNAVRELWDVLDKLRTNNFLGPIGFHLESSQDIVAKSHSSLPRAHVRRSSTSNVTSDVPPEQERHSVVSKVRVRRREWFKIICETRYALHIRMLIAHAKFHLHMPAPVPETAQMQDGSSSSAAPQNATPIPQTDGAVPQAARVKLLMGALLVYTDEVGRPLFIA